jgi:uncharacterized protein YyaL (SSP411 family)
LEENGQNNVPVNAFLQLGGFYSAEDADSLPEHGAPKKREGAFCVWAHRDVQRVLGDRPCRHNENVTLDEIACAVFGGR